MDEKEGVLTIFTGDCVLGSMTPVFSNLHRYMNSLSILKQLVENHLNEGNKKGIHRKAIILPGHGPVVSDALARLE